MAQYKTRSASQWAWDAIDDAIKIASAHYPEWTDFYQSAVQAMESSTASDEDAKVWASTLPQD